MAIENLVGRYIQHKETKKVFKIIKHEHIGLVDLDNGERNINVHICNRPTEFIYDFNLLPEDYSPEQENKFEIGKWYKINNNWYGKISEIGKNRLTLNNSVDCDGKYYPDDSLLYTEKEITFKLLTDLSEIQQY